MSKASPDLDQKPNISVSVENVIKSVPSLQVIMGTAVILPLWELNLILIFFFDEKF